MTNEKLAAYLTIALAQRKRQLQTLIPQYGLASPVCKAVQDDIAELNTKIIEAQNTPTPLEQAIEKKK